MITNTIQGLNELIKNRLIEKKGNVKLIENTDIILYGKALGLNENQLLFKILEIEETIDWAKEKESIIKSETISTESIFTNPNNIIHCSNCNAANEKGVANFCVECGTELRENPVFTEEQRCDSSYQSNSYQNENSEKSKLPYIIGAVVVILTIIGIFYSRNNEHNSISKKILPSKEIDTTQVQISSDQKIELLNNPNYKISDELLIGLFGVSVNDLGVEFIAGEYASGSSPLTFKITSKQFFELGERNLLLASIGISNPNDCHQCLGRLDIGFFEYLNSKWVKIDHLKKADEDTYGRYPEFSSFQVFGKNSLGVVFNHGCLDRIFGVNNNKITQILDIITCKTVDPTDYLLNGELETIAKYEFIDKGENFFTLKVTEIEIGKIKKIKYFNYDNIKSKYEYEQ
jgi:hypothetical protein